MSGLAEIFESFGDLSFETVAETPPVDYSALTEVINESDGLDMAPTVTQLPVEPPVEAAPPPPAPPEAAPPPPPSPPAATAPPPPPMQQPGAFDQDASKGVFNGQGAPETGRFALNKSASWFANLSPQAQAILAGGVAGGAGAVMQSLNQKHALEYQREREERQHQYDVERENRMREDRTRRGHIDPIADNAFTPHGIIDSRRAA